jgi:hypothetical protein
MNTPVCYAEFTELVIVDNGYDDDSVAAGIIGGAESLCATVTFFLSG